MKKLNRIIVMITTVCLCMMALSACGKNSSSKTVTNDNGKINVVTTIFPPYDFMRAIAGDDINLTMLLKPGSETHSFEPTPQDIKTINEADIFIYVGGDSDSWVESILDSVDTENMQIITLMDCVDVVEEEVVEGMTADEHEHEHDEDADTEEEHEHEEDTDTEEEHDHEEVEYDEHVWTSPVNAKIIIQKLCDTLCQVDPVNQQAYESNTTDYLLQLDELDQKFRDVVENAARTEIIVADRFPFRYFADEYDLTYYAAFPGCATDTEPSADTIAFLIDKVQEDQIPVVFHIELSNEKVCDSICEATGAESELLHAVHNISQKDFEAGLTYLDLMNKNVEVLREALN